MRCHRSTCALFSPPSPYRISYALAIAFAHGTFAQANLNLAAIVDSAAIIAAAAVDPGCS